MVNIAMIQETLEIEVKCINGVEKLKKLSIKQEFLALCQSECSDLIREHWEEIAVNKDKIKLNPDWDFYHALEEQDKLRIFTARDEGNLVGYFVTILSYNPHYKDHLFAVNDVLFLSKEYRKGFAGVRLVKFAEKCLKEDGVSVLSINTKVHQPFDQMMDYLNYNLQERVYTKFLGG